MSNIMPFTSIVVANDNTAPNTHTYEMRELSKRREKYDCMKRFVRAYSGDTNPINDNQIGPNARFFMLSKAGYDVGHIRILDYSNTSLAQMLNVSELWCAADAMVKPKYRGQGCLRYMLDYVVANEKVQMVTLEPERYWDNLNYYTTLGFIHPIPCSDHLFRVATI